MPGSGDRGVVIVTDSAASLPPGAASDLGIVVVPMGLVVGNETHPDGALDPDEVVRLASTGRVSVTTSAPSPGQFVAVLESLAAHRVLVTTVARTMSASHDAATIAAGHRPDGRVAVVDTQSATGGQGLVVLAAARAAAGGLGLDEVAAEARRVADRVRLMAVVQQLDQLARSGRVPSIAALAGRVLGVRPVFGFAHGSPRSRRPAHSTAAALRRIVDECLADGVPGHRLHAAVFDAQSPDAAADLESLVRKATRDRGARAGEPVDIYSAPCSAVMVAHTGPGLVGLAWWWEPPARCGSGRLCR